MHCGFIGSDKSVFHYSVCFTTPKEPKRPAIFISDVRANTPLLTVLHLSEIITSSWGLL